MAYPTLKVSSIPGKCFPLKPAWQGYHTPHARVGFTSNRKGALRHSQVSFGCLSQIYEVAFLEIHAKGLRPENLGLIPQASRQQVDEAVRGAQLQRLVLSHGREREPIASASRALLSPEFRSQGKRVD